MFVNKTYLMYYFAIFFSVQAENEWADPPYSLTQEAIDRSVILEDKKLFIPEDLSINTPVLNLYYNKSTYVCKRFKKLWYSDLLNKRAGLLYISIEIVY